MYWLELSSLLATCSAEKSCLHRAAGCCSIFFGYFGWRGLTASVG